MEEFKNQITIFNILVSCFCSIFYISRKYCNHNKKSKTEFTFIRIKKGEGQRRKLSR